MPKLYKSKNILVLGSLAYDYIMNFEGRFSEHILPDKVHILNVSFTAKNLSKQFGGTAGNIAYNLSLLKEIPIVSASAGADFAEYKKWLLNHNISTDYIKIYKDKYTASAHIITDQDDNQITSFHGGAMMCSQYSIKNIINEIKPAIAIIAPNYAEGMILHANELKSINIPYIFDPGQMIISFDKKQLIQMISESKAAIFNDYEMQLFTNKTKLSIDSVRDLTEYLIITLGARGSIIYHGKKEYKIPIAKPKNIVDPTGAGDAYRSGIIKGFLNDWPIEIMGKVSALMSAYAIETYGTQTHTFNARKFLARFEKNFKNKLNIKI